MSSVFTRQQHLSIHLSLDRPHSPFQTASVSNQPFCHNTLYRHIDLDRRRHTTDTRDRRQVYSNSAHALIHCILKVSDMLIITSPPEVIWEERIANSHGRDCTRPLHVLLAAQYQLQTNPITQPRISYIGTAMPRVLYVTLCWLSYSPPSNTPIHRPTPLAIPPTPLTTPNGIRIQSAVLPQYTFRTHRQTNRPTDRQMEQETGLHH